MIVHIKAWWIWRKTRGVSAWDKFLVLLGLKKSETFGFMKRLERIGRTARKNLRKCKDLRREIRNFWIKRTKLKNIIREELTEGSKSDSEQ